MSNIYRGSRRILDIGYIIAAAALWRIAAAAVKSTAHRRAIYYICGIDWCCIS
jgi:hypothetical protein